MKNDVFFGPVGSYDAQNGGPVNRYQEVTNLGWYRGNPLLLPRMASVFT